MSRFLCLCFAMRCFRHLLTLPTESSFQLPDNDAWNDQEPHCLGSLDPNRRRTRLRSTLSTGLSLSKLRRTRFDFLRRRWLRRPLSRRSLP
jgi:hypothetical protein